MRSSLRAEVCDTPSDGVHRRVDEGVDLELADARVSQDRSELPRVLPGRAELASVGSLYLELAMTSADRRPRGSSPTCWLIPPGSRAAMTREPVLDEGVLHVGRGVSEDEPVTGVLDHDRGSALAVAPRANRLDEWRQTRRHGDDELRPGDRVPLGAVRRDRRSLVTSSTSSSRSSSRSRDVSSADSSVSSTSPATRIRISCTPQDYAPAIRLPLLVRALTAQRRPRGATVDAA